MAFLLLSHLRAFAVAFKPPNSELFGYRQMKVFVGFAHTHDL